MRLESRAPPPHLHAGRGLPISIPIAISIPMESFLRTRPTTQTARPRWRRCRSSCRRSSKARWRLRYRTRNRDRFEIEMTPSPTLPRMETVDFLGSALLLPLLPGEGRGEVIERLSSPPFRQRRKSLWQLLRRCRALRAHCSSPHLRPLLEGEESGEDTAPHRKSTVRMRLESRSLPAPACRERASDSIRWNRLLDAANYASSAPLRAAGRRAGAVATPVEARVSKSKSGSHRNRANPLPNPPPLARLSIFSDRRSCSLSFQERAGVR